MCVILQFPKNLRTETFYKFILRWSDGATFEGVSIDDCFRKQKDVFEPEISMDEYLDRFRHRLEVVTGYYYGFDDIKGLCRVLVDNGYLEVIERNGTEPVDQKF